MKKKNVLDSFALVCFFHKEPGWQKINKLFYELSSSGEKAILSIINWGEFYYVVKRRLGHEKAEQALVLVQQLPIALVPVDDRLVKEAATLKSDYPISYADAFCVATALLLGAQILTNDPEYRAVEHLVKVMWLGGKN